MKKLLKITSFLFLLILISCCDNKKSELEFEKNVMFEIYPNLIDSMWIYERIRSSPPNFKLDINNKLIGYQPKDKKKLKEIYNEELSVIKKDSAKIFVVIIDKILKTNPDSMIKLQNHFKNAIVKTNSTIDTLEYSINQKEINSIKSLRVKFISEFKMNERVWENNYKYSIYGVVTFSRIQFDKEKKYGLLTSSVICGGLCGTGYRIFIKKIKNQWVVEKVEEAWIS